MADPRPEAPANKRAAVVCRHPATLRHLQQALGTAGLGMRQAIGPSFLPRSQRGEFELVLLDLDVDPEAPPPSLVAAVDLACPGTPVIAVAGIRTRTRLIEALAAPQVVGIAPKLGTWLESASAPTVAEGPDEQELGVAVRRLINPTPIPPGPTPYLLAGTSVEERVVGSSEEREAVLAEVLEYVDRFGFSDEKLRRIEMVADELLLNAVYDAPVDEQPDGTRRPRFAAVDRRKPVKLGAQEQVRVRFGCDGRTLAVSVCDRFGSLTRAVAVSHVQRVLERLGPRPRTATEGAGLGLVLCYSHANQLIAHSAPGRFTELTAVQLVAGVNRVAQQRGSALYLYL
ncbi:MAG TPA: hypothetical protein VFF06_07530 [Polyangia bacterium]|nr:hypothetical protein [Polyangia bacterium]